MPRAPKKVADQVVTADSTTQKNITTASTGSQSTQQPERQSQLATILIGLLIVASGLLIYNYFQSVTQPDTTTVANQNEDQQSGIADDNSSSEDQSDTDEDDGKNEQRPATPTPTPGQGTYTVTAGDSLWSVAEKVYGDGFRWPEIAQANDLQKDSLGRPVIEVGQVLVAPNSSASIAALPDTEIDEPHVDNDHSSTISPAPDTSLTSYTVQTGDSLWSIAERVYGDGQKWTTLFNYPANNLSRLADGTPLIHAGNVLSIPR